MAIHCVLLSATRRNTADSYRPLVRSCLLSVFLFLSGIFPIRRYMILPASVLSIACFILNIVARIQKSIEIDCSLGTVYNQWTQFGPRIEWESEAGENMSDIVTFKSLGPNRTWVSLELCYDPKGFVESAGDSVGLVSRRVENNLEHFKEFIENRGQETGARRSSIRE